MNTPTKTPGKTNGRKTALKPRRKSVATAVKPKETKPQPKEVVDTSMLTAAAIGYRYQIAELQTKLKEVEVKLGKKPGAAGTASGKRELSPEARLRIAAAQRKRWAEHRRMKAQGDPSKVTPIHAPGEDTGGRQEKLG